MPNEPTYENVGQGSDVGPGFDGVLDAARSGAEWAFAVLYRAMNPRLLRYLSAQAPGEAEDIAAETWMGAARSLAGFEGGEEAFRAWLFKIAYRRLVQHWRDRSRDRSAPRDPYLLTEQPAGGSPEDSVLAADSVAEATRRLVGVLSPDQAQVVILRILGDFSVDQVAGILGKRPGTVRVLQHKALRRLANQNFSLEAVTK